MCYANSLDPEVICSQFGIVYLHDQLVVLRFDTQDLGRESTLRDSFIPSVTYGLSQKKSHWLGSIYNIALTTQTPKCVSDAGVAGRGTCKRMHDKRGRCRAEGSKRWEIVAN